MNKTTKITAAVVALAMPVVMFFEGRVTEPTPDPIGIVSVCYGETQVEMRKYTPAECREMLVVSLAKHGKGIEPCLPETLPPHVLAAVLSFTYNVGAQAFCNSTMAKKLKAGDTMGACAELSRWTYAGGKQWAGLVKRRAAERAMCEGRPPSLGARG